MKNKGISVVLAGLGINLALGILYTWSIFKGSISEAIQSGKGTFKWDAETINDPYAVAVLVFAFAMVPAGKIQDKFGPRITALIGGILVGIGFIWISQTNDYLQWVLGFGVLAGTGIAFGYSSATPPALKWFPPEKTGLIAGIVVSGFGLASAYIAPLAKYLVNAYNLNQAMLFFGIAFLILVSVLSLLLVNPPEITKGTGSSSDLGVKELFKDKKFYLVWIMYFIGAGAGLMVIGHVAGMAKKSMGDAAFWVVAIMAIGNAAGRIVAGILSDKIGRRMTLFLMLIFQAVLMFISMAIIEKADTTAIALVILATFIGFNYGTNLSLFPSFTKDFWGLKNFGIVYGIVFTAWGTGGFILSRASQMLKVSTGSFSSSFLAAGVLLIVAGGLTFLLKKEA